MARQMNLVIREIIRTGRRMIALADEYEACALDDSCLRLGGELRDCGYRLLGKAMFERTQHREAGMWDVDDALDGPWVQSGPCH